MPATAQIPIPEAAPPDGAKLFRNLNDDTFSRSRERVRTQSSLNGF